MSVTCNQLPTYYTTTPCTAQYVVNVDGKLSSALGDELQAYGVSITGYRGKGSLVVHGSPTAIAELSSHERVKTTKQLSAADKVSGGGISNSLAAARLGEGTEEERSQIQIFVDLIRIERSTEVRKIYTFDYLAACAITLIINLHHCSSFAIIFCY